MWIDGRCFAAARNEFRTPDERAIGALRLILMCAPNPGAGELATTDDLVAFSSRAACAFALFRSLSFSLLSFFFARLVLSSVSTSVFTGTPLRRLVNTNRVGRGSKSPASTVVADLRRDFDVDATLEYGDIITTIKQRDANVVWWGYMYEGENAVGRLLFVIRSCSEPKWELPTILSRAT